MKVGDFGLAKLVGSDDAASATEQMGLTMTGVSMGTPHYIAPEQMSEGADVDHRADIYSLGIMFYEMLTGEIPRGSFKPPSQRMTSKAVDVRIDGVVFKAMEPEPDDRYQTVAHLRTDVDEVRTSDPKLDSMPAPAAAGQDSAIKKNAEATKHTANPWGWIAGIAAAVALSVAAIAVFSGDDDKPEPDNQPPDETPGGEWRDLLAELNLEDRTVDDDRAHFRRNADGSIENTSSHGGAFLTLPDPDTPDYELRFTVAIIANPDLEENRGHLSVHLPSEAGPARLWLKTDAAARFFLPHAGEDAIPRFQIPEFEIGKSTQIGIQRRLAPGGRVSIRLSVDGEAFGEWEEDPADLAFETPSKNKPANTLALGIQEPAIARVSELRLRTLVAVNPIPSQIAGKSEAPIPTLAEFKLGLVQARYMLLDDSNGASNFTFWENGEKGSFYSAGRGRRFAYHVKEDLTVHMEFEDNSEVLIWKYAQPDLLRNTENGRNAQYAGKIAGRVGRTNPAAGEWIDLIAMVDPAHDTRGGTWEKKGKSLYTNADGAHEKIALPIRPQGNFSLNINFRQISGNDAVAVRLPIGDRWVDLVLNGWTRPGQLAKSALQPIAGLAGNQPDNPTMTTDFQIEDDQPNNLFVTVIQNDGDVRILVNMGEERLIEWNGVRSDLETYDSIAEDLADGRIWLSSAGAHVRFEKVDLRIDDDNSATALTKAELISQLLQSRFELLDDEPEPISFDFWENGEQGWRNTGGELRKFAFQVNDDLTVSIDYEDGEKTLWKSVHPDRLRNVETKETLLYVGKFDRAESPEE